MYLYNNLTPLEDIARSATAPSTPVGEEWEGRCGV